MVKKATAKLVGLECNWDYLLHFNARPECSMRNSLTGFYKLWGKYLRPIGQTKYGNETIDESVMERMALNTNPKYQPPNLMEFLNKS